MSMTKRRIEEKLYQQDSITLGPEDRAWIVKMLRAVKHDHFTADKAPPDWQLDCPSLLSVTPKLPCNCGADKVNALIDQVIDVIRGCDGDKTKDATIKSAEAERAKEVCEGERLHDSMGENT